ncbi:MAG TPA: hypothetical protein VHP11_00085 [Tepidisphaeraceae bacterium]|nr:hypothetical protein [Tepidisphaeraceae bacterium]
MKTQDVPTASYYTATDSGWTPIVRLIAILGLIIAAFGLLKWTASLLTLFPAFVGKAQPAQLNGSWVFVSIIVLSTWALLLASSIACLYRRDLGRRGMLLCAGLLLFAAAGSGAELATQILRGMIPYSFSKGTLNLAFFLTSRLSSIFADAVFPLFVLTLFRSEQAKQYFKPGT